MRGAFADGALLRSDRIRCGLTQEELADLAGLDVKTVRKAERGGRLDLSTLGRLADVLETETGRLVRWGLQVADLRARRHNELRRWFEAWDAHDRDGVLAIYHEKATLRLPGGPTIPIHGIFHGKAEIGRAHEMAWSTCRTVPARLEELAVYLSDDVAVVEGYKGIYLPNQQIASLWCVQIFTFDGDWVIDHRAEYDTLEFARVLEFPALGENRGSSR